jgi:hypothetical protein
VKTIKCSDPRSRLMDQTVIIIPLGWERDRATLLAQDLRVHRAYLLHRTDHLETVRFAGLVRKDLEACHTEVITVGLSEPHTTLEFEWLLFNIARIIVDETAKKNIVYVNMSASGKVAAAAATIAAMFHKDKVKSLIYVVPSTYAVQAKDPVKTFNDHGLAKGISGRYFLPLFHMQKPPEASLQAIIAIYENGPMKYDRLLEELGKLGVEGFESIKIPPLEDPVLRKREISRWTGRLRRSAIDPVEGLYLETAPSREGPEKIVRLTREGQKLAILTGQVSTLKLT